MTTVRRQHHGRVADGALQRAVQAALDGLDLRDGQHERIGGVRRHRHRHRDRADAQPILPGLPVARVDDIVAEAYPPPANPEEGSP